jgi:hypothetical protein
VKIHPPKSGDASPHNAQGVVGGVNLGGNGYGQKRRRTTTSEDLHESTESTRESLQQNNIPYDTLQREGSFASPADSSGDIERRLLHRLTEIVKQYAGIVVESGSATSQDLSQLDPWLQGKPWDPISSLRDGTSIVRNNRGSIPSTYHVAETRFEDNKNSSSSYAPISSSSHDQTAKATTTGRQFTQGRPNIFSHIHESPEGYPSSGRETNTLPYLPYLNPKQERSKPVDHTDAGDSDGTKNPRGHRKNAEPPHQATASHDSIGDLALGHLSLQEGGRSRYIGNTFWAYIGDEVSTFFIAVLHIVS